MKKDFYAVIMAGGGGTRLWPLSRKDTPKQLLSFGGKDSLFRSAIKRLEGFFDIDHIKVVTIDSQVDSLLKEAPELNRENFIIEPFPKGTASVVGLAAVILHNLSQDAVMAILTADHIIDNLEEFHHLLDLGYDFANKGNLVTLGIKPEYPSTGYGYIKAGEHLSGDKAFLVDQFVEKPDLQTATLYIESGNYYWNSGMFIWQTGRILNEISKHMPNLRHSLIKIETILQKPDYQEKLRDYWSEITPQTIDYGIMEKADNVVMLRADNLNWNDVGSWDSLAEIHEGNENQNVILSNCHSLLDCRQMIVIEQDPKKIIAAVNLENLVIIDTDDALLICRRGETQSVRRIIEELKKNNLNEYL